MRAPPKDTAWRSPLGSRVAATAEGRVAHWSSPPWQMPSQHGQRTGLTSKSATTTAHAGHTASKVPPLQGLAPFLSSLCQRT